jgi:hypothetical protein
VKRLTKTNRMRLKRGSIGQGWRGRNGVRMTFCSSLRDGQMPEQPRDDSAGGVAGDIDGIGDALVEDVGPEPLEEDGPDEEVRGDFPPARRGVVGPQAEHSIGEQEEGQRAGDEERVVEMAVEERRVGVEVRLDEEAVDGVDRERDEEDGVAGVAEGGWLRAPGRAFSG